MFLLTFVVIMLLNTEQEKALQLLQGVLHRWGRREEAFLFFIDSSLLTTLIVHTTAMQSLVSFY